MAKFAILTANDLEETYVFQCPGCGCAHWVRVKGPSPLWKWNDNPDKPTVSPSVHVLPGTDKACHSFVTEGKIQFLGDSWHELKGQTIALPEWDEA